MKLLLPILVLLGCMSAYGQRGKKFSLDNEAIIKILESKVLKNKTRVKLLTGRYDQCVNNNLYSIWQTWKYLPRNIKDGIAKAFRNNLETIVINRTKLMTAKERKRTKSRKYKTGLTKEKAIGKNALHVWPTRLKDPKTGLAGECDRPISLGALTKMVGFRLPVGEI